jgi:hypothetical protein
MADPLSIITLFLGGKEDSNDGKIACNEENLMSLQKCPLMFRKIRQLEGSILPDFLWGKMRSGTHADSHFLPFKTTNFLTK